MITSMIKMTGEDIRNELQYPLICETFTRSEQKKISEIKKQAHNWYLVKGAPDEITMSYDTYMLWNRLAEFCLSL